MKLKKGADDIVRSGDLASVGITLVVATVIGLFMGIYLDRWLGTHPVFTILMLIFGIAAGFVNLFRETAKLNRKNHQQKREINGKDNF